uniref:Uncharacterized protein n=1 Tax=Arundo donax TaxID=35708 RepID=A0A0A9HZ47_ARUDO
MNWKKEKPPEKLHQTSPRTSLMAYIVYVVVCMDQADSARVP